jgi:hypothetical protein
MIIDEDKGKAAEPSATVQPLPTSTPAEPAKRNYILTNKKVCPFLPLLRYIYNSLLFRPCLGGTPP